MQLLNKCAAILSLAAMGACATPAPPRIADSSCTAFTTISYAQLPRKADGSRETNDPLNKADTDETVTQIESHNARWDALCLRK